MNTRVVIVSNDSRPSKIWNIISHTLYAEYCLMPVNIVINDSPQTVVCADTLDKPVK